MSNSGSKKAPQKDGKPKRRRGGQPGNKNALKHGLYSQHVLDLEPEIPDRYIEDQHLDRDLDIHFSKHLEDDHSESLRDEIAMLRIFMRRVIEESNRSLDHRELLDTLRVLSLAATSIARLVKIQEVTFGSEAEFVRTIRQAIHEVSEELNISI